MMAVPSNAPTMPAFRGRRSDEEIEAVIAFISTYATRYALELADAAYALQREQERLKEELAALRERLDAAFERSASLNDRAAELQRRLEPLKAQAGLTPLVGPGVVITFDDARLPVRTSDIARGIIHSQDITDVINAAWQSGGEAVAINGERITGTSACVGAVIQINGTLMSPPYVFSVIGPPERLLASLAAPDELADLKARGVRYGLRFDVRRAGQVSVPAFTGPVRAHFAQVRE